MRFSYRPGLDGVRALAVIAVLAFHDGRLDGGFLGVSTFFTLSGFLITSLLLTERARSGRVSLRHFFARRARRLLPAAFAGIVLAATVAVVVGDARTAANFRADGLAALFNLANWRFLFADQSYADLFATPSPLQHYWSLAVEEQFYLLLAPVLAGLLVLARNRRPHLAAMLGVMAAGSFVVGWLVVDGNIDRAYYGTDTRALEFLVGALVAVALTGRTLSRRTSRVVAALGVVALVGMVGAMIVARTDQTGLFRGGLLLYAIGSALVVVAACEPGPLRAVCSWKPLAALGLISYGIYVFHWPVFVLLTPERAGVDGVRLTMVRMGVTLAIACASFFLLERPIREGRRVVGRTRWVFTPAGALVCAVAAVAVGVGTATGPPAVQFSPALDSAAVLRNPSPPPSATTVPRPGRPEASKPTPPSRVLVVGDSVALTLGRGIERWGAQRGIAVLNAAKLGCSLLDDARVRGYWGEEDRPADSCHTQSEWDETLAKFKPDLVVAMFGAWDVYDASFDGSAWHTPGDPEWNARYADRVTSALTRLRATDARVVWLAPPCFTAGPNGDDPDAPWYDPQRVDTLTDVYKAAADDVAGVEVSDIPRAAGCPVDPSTRPDGVHYSDPGADTVTAQLAPVLLR